MKIDTLRSDMVVALKAHDSFTKNVISGLIGAINNAAIAKKCRDNITEDLIDEVLLKECKTVKEMIDTCPDNRQDLLEEYKQRLSIVEKYAPLLMTDEEEIKNYILSLGIDVDSSNRGLIMKELKGKCDMKIANKVVGGML